MNIATLCTLANLLSAAVPQTALLQTPALQSVYVGSTVRVNCHTGWYAVRGVHWYTQKVRENLQLVYIVRTLSGVAGRFSGEINDNSTTYTLVIHNVQRNDSGLYSCAGRKSHLHPFIFGKGSILLIAGTPTVILLSPSPNETFSMETVPLMCLVSNMISDTLTIDWNVSTWNAESWRDSVTIDSAGANSIRSHIRVPAEAWKNGITCACWVQLNSTTILSESASYHKEQPEFPCLLIFYGSSSVLILLVMMFTVSVVWSCRNSDSGNWNTEKKSTHFRPRDTKPETLYAHLAFTEEQIL
ncbi:uncharacterized protein LOC125487840 [Rhincodon typus]|uniref:uncharacterized protein LOC125487840 n=1 Tax=Rhincodon typus TaxID=259920 RepID=UPI00202DEA57|nr:uncharacterized protein LOC125487840 [Rhincodon typus]